AINRRDIINSAGGYATPDYTMIPPVQLRAIASKAQVSALIRSLPTFPFNLAKAKAELAKSAYPNGFTAKFDTFQYGNFVTSSEAIAGDVAKIGINLQVNVLSISEYLKPFN